MFDSFVNKVLLFWRFSSLIYSESTYANFKAISADLKYNKQTNVHVILLDLEYVYILETVGQY